MRIALPYFPGPLVDPSGGGTYKIFEILREGFSVRGHEVFIIDFSASRIDPKYGIQSNYVHIVSGIGIEASTAKQFIEFCEIMKIDVIIPLNNTVFTSSIPHLPCATKIVMHCNSNIAHAYHHVTRFSSHVSKILVGSPRELSDLIDSWQVPKQKITLVPYGIEPLTESLERKDYEELLHLTYVGRIEYRSKGTDALPKILKYLVASGLHFDLEIIGAGPDEKHLKASLDSFKGYTSFTGSISNSEVLKKLARKHILIMPSRIEGFGFVAIEAMSLGVVPIVNKIPGVLDWVIQDGRTGFVRSREKPRDIAEAILELAHDRERLKRISQNGFYDVLERFSLKTMVDIHVIACQEAIAESQYGRPAPLDFSSWNPFLEWNPSVSYKIKWRAKSLLSKLFSVRGGAFMVNWLRNLQKLLEAK
jgi:glycosyltransferase involved in cell wall biosynthesis